MTRRIRRGTTRTIALPIALLLSCGGRSPLSDSETQLGRSSDSTPNTGARMSAAVPPDPLGIAPLVDDAARRPENGVRAEGLSTPNAVLVDETPEEQVSVVTGDAIASDAGSCSAFIDIAGSPLRAEDIRVSSAGNVVPFDSRCEVSGFYLDYRSDGLFLTLCETACEPFVSNPAMILEIAVTFGLSRNRPAAAK